VPGSPPPPHRLNLERQGGADVSLEEGTRFMGSTSRPTPTNEKQMGEANGHLPPVNCIRRYRFISCLQQMRGKLKRQTTPSSLHRGHPPGATLRAQVEKNRINSCKPWQVALSSPSGTTCRCRPSSSTPRRPRCGRANPWPRRAVGAPLATLAPTLLLPALVRVLW
jgi:hypothetical protein